MQPGVMVTSMQMALHRPMTVRAPKSSQLDLEIALKSFRGPQGTLYGQQCNVGGAVNFICSEALQMRFVCQG